MTAIIKHHIDYGDYRCGMKQPQPAEDTNDTLTEHDKRVLDTVLSVFSQYHEEYQCSRRADNEMFGISLTLADVPTSSGKQWNSKRLQNFRQRMVKRKNAVIDYILHQSSPAAISQTARLMDDKEVFDVNVSLRLNIASGEAYLIDNISRRKKNLSVDIDYNHKPESNRGRLNADFNDYRATRYLMAAE